MAYITKGIGGFYYVKTTDGIVECKARGIFRKRGITPVAGDNVTLSDDGTMIDEILPRNAPAVNRGGAAFCVLGLLSGAQFTGQAPGGRRIRHFVLAGAAMLCCGATSGNRWI